MARLDSECSRPSRPVFWARLLGAYAVPITAAMMLGVFVGRSLTPGTEGVTVTAYYQMPSLTLAGFR